MNKAVSLLLVLALTFQSALAGISFVRGNGITLTGADGITLTGADGITLTGADGFLAAQSNGITLTGADGITLTGADGITLTGPDGATYAGQNGITLTGADGITLTGADGITLTGADGITLTGADGTQYTANTIFLTLPQGITLTGADGITLTGADGITLTGADGAVRKGVNGITLTGADGITLTGADGITLTGADGITLTGADGAVGVGANGVVFELQQPQGITLTGADGITLTGADGITLTGADGITLTGADGITLTGADQTGIQSVDPELLVQLNTATDDSNINAVVIFHGAVTDADISQLQSIGISGGTRFRKLPMVNFSGTKSQIIAVSRLARVRSIYGNRTLDLNADPYFKRTGIDRVASDQELTGDNGGLAVSGRNVTVAVLDTGINATHADLAGKVVQNVKLADIQSVPLGFVYPQPVEGLANSDLASGHGTFVGGIIAGSGTASAGKFAGVAPGAKLLGLSAGNLSLLHVLSGFDYLLDRGANYNVRVVNCSFSADVAFDLHDPVNVATKMLTDAGVAVVFSAGNSGAGDGSLNPYAAAPWVIGVGATDETGRLAGFSSRGSFGNEIMKPAVVAPGVNVAGPRSAGTTTGSLGLGGADAQRLSPTEMPFYTTASGTSFSAPQVAGAIALMLEADPSLTPADAKDIIQRTATPLPKYFQHEAGAGMLNTHAAVLEAAFPERRMGTFRSTLSQNKVRFVTNVVTQQAVTAMPGVPASTTFSLPADTVQAAVRTSWGLSANDFGLRVFKPDNSSAGTSNRLNLAGLLGRNERVTLHLPSAGTYRAETFHTAGIGTAQNVNGSVEITRVEYPNLNDLGGLSTDLVSEAEKSLLMSTIMPWGNRFYPQGSVSRYELAETLVRAGLVPQYFAASPVYWDVRDRWTRGVVESVQAGPAGQLIYDAQAGGRFYPFRSAERVVAAVAMVRAAGMEQNAATATLPMNVTDAASIPAAYRGHVAIALQQGWLTLNNNKFEPTRSLTRIELARATNKIIGS